MPRRFNEPGRFMKKSRARHARDHGDPLEGMSNLFDIALLIGVALLIMALSGFGLNDLLSKSDVTMVKNPGKIDMELITKTNGTIKRMKATGQTVEGVGMRIGSVYRLQDGQVIWLPETEGAVGATTTP